MSTTASSILETSLAPLVLGVAASAADDLMQRLEQLNMVGASLSAERDIDRLLESILVAAKSITRADGGTLYRVTEERSWRRPLAAPRVCSETGTHWPAARLSTRRKMRFMRNHSAWAGYSVKK